MMKIYVDDAGNEYDVPERPSPEEAAWIRQNGLRPKGSSQFGHTTKDVLQSVLSKGAQGLARAPLIGGDMMNLGMRGINAIRPGTFEDETIDRFGSQGWIDAFKGSPQDKATGRAFSHEPQTKTGRYAGAASEVVAGSVGMGALSTLRGLKPSPLTVRKGGSAALSPGMLGIETAAGTAGEFAQDVTRDFDDTKDANPFVGGGVALLTALLGGGIRSARNPNLDRRVFNATKSMTDADWASAAASVPRFQSAGSKTFTAADLDGLHTRLGGIAHEVVNSSGGEALRQKLNLQSRMNEDVTGILGRTTDSITGPFDHRVLAENLSGRGDKIMHNAVEDRQRQVEQILQSGGNVDPKRLLAATNRYVRKPRYEPHHQGSEMRRALDEAEKALLGKDALTTPLISQVTPPILNLQSLSQNVKGVRDIPAHEAASPKGSIRNFARAEAGTAAEQALTKASPVYRQAMNLHKNLSQNMAPLERGLPGQVRGVTNDDQLLTRLRNVPVDQLPGELRTLGVTPDEAKKLARIIAERVKPIPVVPQASHQNLEDRKILDALLDYADPALRGPVNQNLGVADRLSQLVTQHAADRAGGLQMGANPVSSAASPLGTATIRSSLSRGEKEYTKLADLIANPTPENLAHLRRLSKVDPRAKRALEWIASMTAAAQGGASDATIPRIELRGMAEPN